MANTGKRLTVLLTGPGGRIGPHILPLFEEKFELRILDKKPVPGFEDRTFVTDLQDIGALREACRGVDVVVHLAAQSDEAPFVEKLVPHNVVGVYNLFQAALEADVRRIVFAGTVQSVGYYPHDVTVGPNDPPRPVSLYGATKVLAEAMGRFYHDRHGREFVSVRIGHFQDYHESSLRKSRGTRRIWLSPRDAASLLARAAEKEGVGYAVIFATSRTEQEFLSLAPARDLLGWEPEDDVANFPYEGS